MIKDLNEWTIPELLNLYKRLEDEASDSESRTIILWADHDSQNEYGWDMTWRGGKHKYSYLEHQLVSFLAGQRDDIDTLLIPLYSICGHFREAIKDKLYDEIPSPPESWTKHLRAYVYKEPF